ncbi:protein rhomboid isoform X1 [Coccinella septempunctata]|uniref:protein rhomboid isoform X1 n=1 Tax=Coccinella septempunctata TaxID=41139 RepID=UPI001D062DFC|nr:protein rhomboid isoform X1 [Coccinella septempunctata]
MLSHSSWPHRLSPSVTLLNTSLALGQSEESGIEPGPIATITGSLFSFPEHGDLDHYDTDHTDLGSEADEAELRRALLRDQWRQFFDEYDREGFGEIPWDYFLTVMNDVEFCQRVSPGKREILLEKSKNATTPAITFQDFVNVMTGKRTRSFKCAVHHRDREVSSESDYHLITENPSIFRNRMVTIIADQFLTDDRDRKYYADRYTCKPPPVFIVFITLVELGFFVYYSVVRGEVNPAGPVPIDSVFIYRPDKRREIWRFLLYMMLHAGWLHLGFNLVVQMVVGLPLEMVHGSGRVALIYMAGVVAGSLGTSVFDTDVCLVGASGGVYALLAGHLANIMLNYNNMQCGILKLVGIIAIASCDVGYAIYSRYAGEVFGPPVSYVAHLTGALAGLTIGLLVLKNFEQKLHEQLLWWVALGVYAACTIFAILFNVMNPSVVPLENLGEGVDSQYIYSRFGV